MTETRKHLKTSSLIVLLFAGLTLLQIVAELMYGELNSAEIPAGSPDNILLITKMILLGFTVLFLLPQVYVGVKGVRMAKNPNGSKGHIIWAGILLAFAVVNLISPLVGLVQGTGSDNFGRLFGYLLEIAIYYDYIKYATAVSKEYCQIAE